MANSRSVLIVDDNRQNLDLAEDILLDEGYEVFLASDGREGLEAVRKYHPDVILLDIMMPGINGLDFCKRLKSYDNDLASTKVIMLTAKAGSEDIIEGLEMGADDYLTKPYHTGELIARVKTQSLTKEAEDALKTSLNQSVRLAVIGNMVGRVSHDFKNILTELHMFEVVEAYMEDAKNAIRSDNAREAERITEKIIHLSKVAGKTIQFGEAMVNGLVTYARGANSKQKVQEISSFLKVPLDILNRKIRMENVDLVLDIDKKTPPVKCDAGELQQIVLNLVTNALYSMKGSTEKQMEVKLWADNGFVNFSISDTGSGIPPEAQPYIFDDLFSTKPAGKGSGIGLSTVKKIVNSHNGEINFLSKVDKGTTFIISLPVYNEPS